MENEEEYAVALLRRLDGEPHTASRVDLGRAIAEGTRRRRIRRVVGAGGAAVLVVAAVAIAPVALSAVRPGPVPARVAGATGSPSVPPTPTVAAPTSCGLERLPIPGGEPMSLVTGADPTGRFVLGRAYPVDRKGSYPVLIWDHGESPQVRQVSVPGTDQALKDVTSAGVAVGSGWQAQGPIPYVYRDGKVSPLPGVKYGEALAINEAGQIVGSRQDAGPLSVPVIWRGASAQPVELALPGPGWRGNAVDIDEDGTVIGMLWDVKADPQPGTISADPKPGTIAADPKPGEKIGMARNGRPGARGYLWLPDGTLRELPKPMLQGVPADAFRPTSIRNGWVTGVAERQLSDGTEISSPVRLHLPTGTFVDLPATPLAVAAGNGQGWVVGSTTDGRLGLLTDAGLLTLPDLGHPDRDPGNVAVALSDDGRTIAGQEDDSTGHPQAVVWPCR